MLKKTFMIMLLAVISAVAYAQQSRWTYYGAYHNSLANIPVGNEIYSLCDGSIFSYSPSDSEVRVYDKTNGLSDVDIKRMAYSSEKKCFVLIYYNSNIDLFYPEEGSVANMPQFMNSSLSDKTVNDLCVAGSKAYIASNSGITVIDLDRIEFSKTYNIGSVSSCAYLDGKLYASTAGGVMAGDEADNLLDPSKWKTLTTVKFSPLRAFAGKLYGQAVQLFTLNTTDGSFGLTANFSPTFICNDGERYMFFGNSSAAYQISVDGTLAKIHGDNTFNYITFSGGKYWVSNGFSGTQPYEAGNGGVIEPSGTGITLDSPIRNYCAFMHFTPSNKLLVAGGTMNYNLQNYDGTLYSFEDGKFNNFEDTITSYTAYPYRNLTGIAEDPEDPTHHFASSGETGLYEFRNGKFVAHYDHTNSPIETVLPTSSHAYLYNRVTALQYDSEGNLWMFNDEVDTIVKVLMHNGTWHSIYIDELAGYPTFDHIIFDDAGRAWFTQRRTTGVHNAGVGCLDYNGTIGDLSDDHTTFRYRFTNEDGTTYAPTVVYSIAKDNEGRIWVGTVDGPFLVNNPDDFSKSDFTFEQVKVPRNDGTDLADYLLTGVPISAIAVDGANRKWFGTNGDGLYLISADNIQTLEHFTSANSPLVSDNIVSLAVNNATGTVMIGTDKGLMSYEAGKTSAGGSLKDDDLKIYPNPVRPDFYGDVTIEGLPYGAEIKITTTGGQLVRSAKTSSGSYKWDVKDNSGAGVGSGVYYVLAVTSDGKHGARGRIVVIR